MYSKDLRQAACKLYERCKSLRETAELFGIGKSTLQRWCAHGVKVKQRLQYPTKITSPMKELIKECINKDPCTTAIKLKKIIYTYTGCNISKQLVLQAICACGYTKKRCRKRGGVPTPERVKEYCTSAFSINPETCIFVDETYIDYSEHSSYGYSMKGQRATKVSKRNHPGMTLTLAMTSTSLVHQSIVKGASNTSCFLDFLKGLNAVEGTTLVIDNVGFHHSRPVKDYCIARKFNVLYTPPYSPDFNPIENVFGFLKQKWRSMAPENRDHSAFCQGAEPVFLRRCVLRAWRLVADVLEDS